MAALKQVNINGWVHCLLCAPMSCFLLAHDGHNGQMQLSVHTGDKVDHSREKNNTIVGGNIFGRNALKKIN